MKKILLVLIFSFIYSQGYSETLSINTDIVGIHQLRIVNKGKKHCPVSIPLIKKAVVCGRLEGVKEKTGVLIDKEALFDKLNKDKKYFFLVRNGKERGGWFLINSQDSPTQITVKLDKGSGNIENLNGNELFSIHQLYSLNELFPPDGSVLPANKIDIMAGQIHINSKNIWKKYWLSNGELSEEAGWIDWASSKPIKLKDLFFMPGSSFIIFHPDPDRDIDIHIIGSVMDFVLKKTITPGYNYVSVEYNTSRTDINHSFSTKLKDLRLINSGFASGQDSDSSDGLIIWNVQQKEYNKPYWLFNNNGHPQWMTAANEPVDVDNAKVIPGTGLIIHNISNPYTWFDGK